MTGLLAVLLLAAPVETAPLEGAEHLGRFFAALARREGPAPSGRVRVTHFGDSHVAADLWTGRLRAALQARFGDGGRGFVLAGRPWQSYWQAHVRADHEGAWRVDGLRGGLDDGWSGPAGCSLASADPDAVVRVATPANSEAAAAFDTLEVHYLRQPAGGCFEVRVDGHPVGRISTRGPWLSPESARFTVDPGPHEVTLHPLLGGETRLLGVSMTRAEGLVYDALGLNGARMTKLLQADPVGFAAVLRRLAPDLVVLSYGANELADARLDPKRYAADLDRVLRVVRRAVQADCLLTGPPDMAVRGRAMPLADTVADIQRSLADAHGCAFWDARRAMGGPGAVRRWRRLGLAAADLVHLTRDGYATLAAALHAALLDAHTARRTDRAGY